VASLTNGVHSVYYISIRYMIRSVLTSSERPSSFRVSNFKVTQQRVCWICIEYYSLLIVLIRSHLNGCSLYCTRRRF